MIKRAFSRLWNDDRGNALIIAGAALPLIVGSAGLATDTIQWTMMKRQLQRAADSAAIAGVYARLQNQTVSSAVTTDLCVNNVKQTSCATKNMVLSSGFPQSTLPADTGVYRNAVEVTLAIAQPLNFSSMFVSGTPKITARARAGVINGGEYCVLSLENTAVTGLTMWGNASLDLGCGMMTNSTSLNAAAAGGSASVKASPIAAVGGIQSSNNYATGTTFAPFSPSLADPFASVMPTPPTSPCPAADDPDVGSNKTGSIGPGCYKSLSSKGTLNLSPGTYYIDGGGIDIGAQGSINGANGVTIVLSNSSAAANATIGSIEMNGGSNLNLVAPDIGNYKGIAIYQDRRATSGVTAKINGNSGSTFQGALYFPQAALTFTGNSGMQTNCMQLVARRVTFTGSSAVSNVCPANSESGSFTGTSGVRLVG